MLVYGNDSVIIGIIERIYRRNLLENDELFIIRSTRLHYSFITTIFYCYTCLFNLATSSSAIVNISLSVFEPWVLEVCAIVNN